MKTLVLLSILTLAACGDSTGPTARCVDQKRAFLAEHFGADFSPTPQLLNQDIINLSDTKQAVFAADCSVAIRDTPH